MTRTITNMLLKFALLCFLVVPAAQADDANSVPEDKQNALGLYLTSSQAHEHMKTHGGKTLFMDIRDPVEIHVLGMPQGVDANVPFKLIDTKHWDEKKGQFKLASNPNFFADVEAALKAKGLGKDDQIIAICGSGKRAAKTVDAMAKAGYKNVYSVTDGFKGWTANKLPFDKKLDRKKIYGNPQ